MFGVIIACSGDDVAPGGDAAADVATCEICSVQQYVCGFETMTMESFFLLTSDRRSDACKVEVRAGFPTEWNMTCEPPQLCNSDGTCLPLTVMSRSFKWTPPNTGEATCYP